MTATSIKCPHCGGVMAEQDAEGRIFVRHRGKRWRFGMGSRLEECFCDKCHKPFIPVLATESTKAIAGTVGGV